jgi:hypothetical protein
MCKVYRPAPWMTSSRRWAARVSQRARCLVAAEVRRNRNRSRIDFPPNDERVEAFLPRPIEGLIPMNSFHRSEFPDVRGTSGGVNGSISGSMPLISRSARAGALYRSP